MRGVDWHNLQLGQPRHSAVSLTFIAFALRRSERKHNAWSSVRRSTRYSQSLRHDHLADLLSVRSQWPNMSVGFQLANVVVLGRELGGWGIQTRLPPELSGLTQLEIL